MAVLQLNPMPSKNKFKPKTLYIHIKTNKLIQSNLLKHHNYTYIISGLKDGKDCMEFGCPENLLNFQGFENNGFSQCPKPRNY